MKAVLWGIALGSLCLLQAAADITVQPDFDVNKIAGKWYDIAITFQHGDSVLKNENGHHITIVVAKNGSFYHYEQMPETNCNSQGSFFDVTGRPGIYTMQRSTLYMLKTDYTNYAFIYTESPGERILHLYGRKRRVSKDIKEEYRKLTVERNLPFNHILYFKKAGPCPKMTFPEVS